MTIKQKIQQRHLEAIISNTHLEYEPESAMVVGNPDAAASCTEITSEVMEGFAEWIQSELTSAPAPHPDAERLAQIFDNNTDCFADTWVIGEDFMKEGKVIAAMTKDAFIKALTCYNFCRGQQGLKFVKVSERNPTEPGNYYVKVFDKEGDGYIFAALVCFTLGMWEVTEETHEVVEWLDESAGQQGGWIPVEERLPDFDVPVLWISENGGIHVEELDKDGNPWLFEKNGVFGLPTDNDPYIGNVVTHWMPLPTPPNQ